MHVTSCGMLPQPGYWDPHSITKTASIRHHPRVEQPPRSRSGATGSSLYPIPEWNSLPEARPQLCHISVSGLEWNSFPEAAVAVPQPHFWPPYGESRVKRRRLWSAATTVLPIIMFISPPWLTLPAMFKAGLLPEGIGLCRLVEVQPRRGALR